LSRGSDPLSKAESGAARSISAAAQPGRRSGYWANLAEPSARISNTRRLNALIPSASLRHPCAFRRTGLLFAAADCYRALYERAGAQPRLQVSPASESWISKEDRRHVQLAGECV
jgi:hypothetical protein